ncbi:MAG: hypothetical protein FWE06_03280 [Oscillospiraceae bacterium]|nr:hypothetical protein [Oscillospiraceae bacterium]
MKQEMYESLREQYPAHISLDHLHRICRIAKRSARYLVEHGIIPAEDTGKQTWRYKIALDDVITYLRRREQVGSMIPHGAVTSHKQSTRKCFAQLVLAGQESDIADYFNYIYAGYEDLLTSQDITEMTGLELSTVLKLLKAGAIKSIMTHPKYLIPKPYLLEFVVTPRFIEYRTNSEQFKKIIGGFEIWKTKS